MTRGYRKEPFLIWTSFVSFLVLCLGAPAQGPALSGQQSARAGSALSILPEAAALAGWAPAGRPEVYEGEALYEYIDGGAEIYQEYGFREVAVQDYKNEAGKTVVLEVYLMSSPAAAYGIYTFKTTGRGRLPGWGGVEAEVESYYLNMWGGPFLVTMTGLDESPETSSGLLMLGQAAAARLSGSLEKPFLIGGLPRAGLGPGSIKYFRGRLGLNNIRVLFSGRAFPFSEGVRALYEEGAELFIFACGGSAEARAAMALIQEAARADERLRNFLLENQGFSADDGTSALSVGVSGSFILVVRAATAARAGELSRLAAANLAGRGPAP